MADRKFKFVKLGIYVLGMTQGIVTIGIFFFFSKVISIFRKFILTFDQQVALS